jgi:lipopolysaccharide assembly outer membrane protein LptD (OstA)
MRAVSKYWLAAGLCLAGAALIFSWRFQTGQAPPEDSEGDAKETIALSGDVEVRWDQYAVRTERATYHRGEGLVKSDAAVALEGPGLRVSGKGFEVDVDAQRARVLDRVTATVRGRRK